MILSWQSAWLLTHPGTAIAAGVLVVLATAAALLWTHLRRFAGPRARRVLQVAWVSWCAMWAFAWLVSGVSSTLQDYAGAPADTFTVTAATIDMLLPIGLGVASLWAIRAPIGRVKPQQ
jgi:hypothetical protein